METITVGGLTMSVPCDAIDAALATAQGEMQEAERTATNPHFEKTYAGLASIIGATRVLAKHGIALTQHPFDLNGRIGMTTMLKHKGQFIASTFSMKSQQDTPQGNGSCLTYLKRYTAAAICGLAISDSSDDDGHAASLGAEKKAANRDKPDRTRRNERPKEETNGHAPATPPAAEVSVFEKAKRGWLKIVTQNEVAAKRSGFMDRVRTDFEAKKFTQPEYESLMALIETGTLPDAKPTEPVRGVAEERVIRASIAVGEFDEAASALELAIASGAIRGEQSSALHAAIEQGRRNAEKGGFVTA